MHILCIYKKNKKNKSYFNLLSCLLIASHSLPLMSPRLLGMPVKMSFNTFVGIIIVLDLGNRYLGPLSATDKRIVEIQQSLGWPEAQVKRLVDEVRQATEGRKVKWRFNSIVIEKLNLVEFNCINLVKSTSTWRTDEPP